MMVDVKLTLDDYMNLREAAAYLDALKIVLPGNNETTILLKRLDDSLSQTMDKICDAFTVQVS